MSLIEFQNTLIEKIKQTIEKDFNISFEKIAAEAPSKVEFGDLAFPVAFEIAKYLKNQKEEKQNPRVIAEQIKKKLPNLEFVQDIQVAGSGYINVFYDRAKFLLVSLKSELLPNQSIPTNNNSSKTNNNSSKICVEHTSVNPNKAAHIGHIRNAVLGDTLVRILRAYGNRVEVQNYVDNTGVQVADVVIGFIHIEKMNLEDIKSLDAKLKQKKIAFDYYCWDLYTKVGAKYQQNKKLVEERARTIRLIEEGDNETASLADYVATRNVECILDTMERLSIRYELLPRESEILHLDFWKKAFEMMKKLGAIKFVEDGKMAGCWVMPFQSYTGSDEHDQDKILVRSNGTVTYTGKDIAYQMWKLGLLGLDFNYDKFSSYENGDHVWITTTNSSKDIHPEFGSAAKVYNVIDARQSYPQEVIKKGVATIFPEKGEEASIHLSYEMVALSPKAAEVLGFEISQKDKQKTFIDMSGRKGLGVKADDLINRLEKNALVEVKERNPGLTEETQHRIAHEIAIGALRYFLLKFTKNTVIIFDFEEATSFEGETGTYCQNAVVRLNSIFRKIENEALKRAVSVVNKNFEKTIDIFQSESGNDFWSAVILASRLEETIVHSIKSSEPAVLAKYAFKLAKTSNLFYQKHRIKGEPDELKRAVMICVAEITRRSLTKSLEIMGIKIPERM